MPRSTRHVHGTFALGIPLLNVEYEISFSCADSSNVPAEILSRVAAAFPIRLPLGRTEMFAPYRLRLGHLAFFRSYSPFKSSSQMRFRVVPSYKIGRLRHRITMKAWAWRTVHLRFVSCPSLLRSPIRIELLDAVVPVVRHIDVARTVHGYVIRGFRMRGLLERDQQALESLCFLAGGLV